MEVVTACCKGIMIIINKYAAVISAVMVGMETSIPAMEWPRPLTTATERQLWLKEKLTDIDCILMKLLEGIGDEF